MQKEVDHLTRNLMVLSSLLYLISISFMSIITETELSFTFIGMLPFLMYIISFFAIYNKGLVKTSTTWITPLVFPLMFYIVWNTQTIDVVSRMEGGVVAVLNILFSYAYNGIIFLFLRKHHYGELRKSRLAHKAMHYKQKAEANQNIIEELRNELDHVKEQSKVNSDNFSVKLRGIEDKCKAINFTIGRVYSDKRGGSKDIRAKLRIQKELYNQFSQITADIKKHHIDYLLDILSKLYTELTALELKERQVLGQRVLDKYKDEQIITILAINDNEPVLESYTEAKEVCEGLIKFVKGENY